MRELSFILTCLGFLKEIINMWSAEAYKAIREKKEANELAFTIHDAQRDLKKALKRQDTSVGISFVDEAVKE